jgi:hypothetical protein
LSSPFGVKPVVQSAAVVVPPVPALAPPEKTFLTCQVDSASGPVSCSGNIAGSAAAFMPSQMYRPAIWWLPWPAFSDGVKPM